MATPMGPPVLPGYSLRVQLFSPTAHALGDKPIRCFRVVTSPDVTVREFCQEVSRIHEINYGEPLAIKKVQDDQEFDITQSEILGHLFPTTSIIRVIQALANPGIRDSVPPTSALRFDPNITRKRDREGSIRPNGHSPSNAWKPNKRQRVTELDPDEPLPSRESESGRRAGPIPEVNIIPDSQERVIPGPSSGYFGTLRNVRQQVPPHIPETPSPSPPPELHKSQHLANGSADQQREQSAMQTTDEDSKDDLQIENSSPLGQAAERAQSHGSQRAKSSSYHISRPTERGTSVSTAATSPFSVDQQGPTQNGITSSSKRKRPEATPKSYPNRSPNEDSIYDNIVSEDEGAAKLGKKKASLKMRNSPNAGLPGIDWANNKFNTPPTGNRRPSRPQEGSSAGELPLTPNSKERERRQQEKRSADEAKVARRAAAEAAEQRKLDAEEARQSEEVRIAEEERAKREEQERLEVEEFQRGEAKRQAAIVKAARLRKEQEAKEKKEIEEKRRLEESQIAKDKAELDRLARKKAEADARRLHQEEEERERKRQAEEVEMLRQEEEKRQAAEEERRAEEASKKKIRSRSPEVPRKRQSSSPILPRNTPSSASRPQSSTPYIPNGRKSALKSSLSSQAVPSSSPRDPKLSPEISRDVGIEAQIPLPSKLRKVSFDLHENRKETPIKPPSRISPPKSATPKTSSSSESVAAKASKDPAPKPSQQGSTPPVKQSRTPIPVPSTLKRSSLERSTRPAGRTTTMPPRKEPSPPVTTEKITPTGSPTSQKSETPIDPPANVKPKPAEIVISDDSDSDSEEDIPAKVTPAKSAKSISLSSKKSLARTVAVEPEQSEDEEIDEDETQSHNSSTRDSRSPVVYIQHVEISEPAQAPRSASTESESDSEEAEDSTSSQSVSEGEEEKDREPTPKAKAKDDEMEENEEEEGSEDSESESEDEGTEVQVPKSSPHILPAVKPSQVNNSKTSITEDEISTQDEIDQQLTSSMFEARSTINSSAVPSSSAIRPPQIKYGASLSSLNSNKSLYGSSSPKPSTAARSSRASRVNLVEENESESEEESDDDSTPSDEDDNPAKNKQVATVAAKKTQQAASESDSDDSSSEDSSSDSEEGLDEETRARIKAGNELAATIKGLTNGDSQVSLPSPKGYRSATQEVKGKGGKKGEKKVDKYLVRQKFSMPA